MQGNTQGKPPAIFDESLVRTREMRAARRRARGECFLLARIADDIAERLQDVNRTFARALLIAPDGFAEMLLSRLPEERHPTLTLARPSEHTRLQAPPASFDLVIAVLGLGLANDPVGSLIEARTKLVPDGLLLAAFLGGESLTELRSALYALDTDTLGSPAPRLHPAIGHVEAGQLLARAGLALPVVDFDRFTVRYAHLQTLVADLRDAGLTNSLAARGPSLPRDTLARLSDRLRDGEGKHPTTFEILYLTAWHPHESQQKPLKPGSAQVSLGEALKPNK